jgi:single-strand DNA-binding protein
VKEGAERASVDGASAMHQVTLWGRLGREVDYRRSDNGKDVANLRVGVDDRYRKEGRSQKKVMWFDVVAFDGLARVCSDHLEEDSGVLITGRLNFREYTNRDGQRVKTFEVVADNISFTDPPPGGYRKND